MATGSINVGPTLRRRREWARLTQQELCEHTRLDRSSSYLGAVERGKTSPTLEELEALARYFRITLFELLEEAQGDQNRREGTGPAASGPEIDDRVQGLFSSLSPDDQELALDLLTAIQKRRARS